MGTLLGKWQSWREDKRRTELIGESDAPHVSLYGVKTAVLLPALMTSAYAAEKLGDRALALKSIGSARAILALLRRSEYWRPDEAIVHWEHWAKAYADAQP